MPRPAPQNSCSTCRRRKIKCDGQLPVCLNCQKATRECHRPPRDTRFIIHSEYSNVASVNVPTFQPADVDVDAETDSDLAEARESVSCNPQEALQHPLIAKLFRHYVDFLAPWYDLNDLQNLFGTVVPIHALENSVLFKALIAFSACHKNRVSGKAQGIGAVFHAACVHDLLEAMKDLQPELQGDYLAATCLLRSYEILNGDTRQQQHLLGAYSFASNEPVDLNIRSLSQAGTWNYLREDITVALECQRPVRYHADFHFQPRADMADDMWAHAISHILARIINFCFVQSAADALSTNREQMWQGLKAEVQAWRNGLPESFKPFSTALKDGNAFPSVWLTKPYHVAGEQYCCVAEMLLGLSQPGPGASPFGLIDREAKHHTIETFALMICGLAFTNDDISSRVNAFGPLAFCGRYLAEAHHRTGLIAMLRDFSIPTGWPVGSIIEDLQRHWSAVS